MARGIGGWRWWAGLGTLAAVVSAGLVVALVELPALLHPFLPQARPPTVAAVRVFVVAMVVASAAGLGLGLGLAGGVHRSRRAARLGLWSALLLAAAVAVGLMVWKVPPALYRGDGASAKDTAVAVANTRAGFLVGLAGLAAVVGLALNRQALAETERANRAAQQAAQQASREALEETQRANRAAHQAAREALEETQRANRVALEETRRVNERTHDREREAQLTERYTRAVDQLGSAVLDVRLGGIYALERLARDSPPSQPTIVEVLSAFARVHSTDPALRPAATPTAPSGTRGNPKTAATPTRSGPVRPAVDVHAAVTVLARLPVLKEVPRAALTGADLTGPASLARLHVPRDGSLAHADLTDADLTGASLDGVDLTDATLIGADLTRAALGEAELTRADLADADLTRAVLGGANLTRARLGGASLTSAWLVGANLTDTRLDKADLTDARLGGANLTRADLGGANLTDTRLVRADLTGARLGEANLTDARLDGANLTDAWLDGANLTRADLADADLTNAWLVGANLTDAQGLTQEQLDTARGDASTVLPAGLTRPASWPSEDADA
jgi:uncharacterized protein YjbI with pentapeptide repeats